MDDAVVVGATGTLGSVPTTRLAARGLRVVAVARDEAALAALASRAAAGAAGLVVPCPADISDNASVDAIHGALAGQVRLAVRAAGLPVRGSVAVAGTSGLEPGRDEAGPGGISPV